MSEVAIRVKPVDKAVEKYLERARAGRALYEFFVQNPKRNPIEAAISMKQTLKEKMSKDETWDLWETKLKGIGYDGWLDATLRKGVARFVPGIEYGAKYWRQFYEQFSKHLAEGLKKVYALPRVTLDDAIRRAEVMIRHNAEFKFIKKHVA